MPVTYCHISQIRQSNNSEFFDDSMATQRLRKVFVSKISSTSKLRALEQLHTQVRTTIHKANRWTEIANKIGLGWVGFCFRMLRGLIHITSISMWTIPIFGEWMPVFETRCGCALTTASVTFFSTVRGPERRVGRSNLMLHNCGTLHPPPLNRPSYHPPIAFTDLN